MRKILAYLLIISIVLPLLAGCYDAREVDDNLYVLSIGLDKGVSDKLRLTLQFNAMKGGRGGEDASGGSSGGSSENYKVVSIDAPSFYAGINLLNTSLPRKINLSHAKYIVFSEELGKSEDLGVYLAPIARYREARRTMSVIVSKSSALEFIEANKPYIGSLLSKNQEGLIKESDDTSFFPKTNLNDLYNSVKSPYGQPIAIYGAVNKGRNFEVTGRNWEDGPKTPIQYSAGELPRYGDNKIELFGCALADGDKIVGELNGIETRAMLMVQGKYKRGVITANDPQKPGLVVPINVMQQRKPDIKLSIENGKPIIHLKIKLDGEICAIQSSTNYADPKLKPLLEHSFEEDIKKIVERTIKKCQGYKCDVFNFGYSAVKHFKTIQEWENYNWINKFSGAEVITEVDVKIRRTGELVDVSPVLDSQGKKYR